MIILNKGKNTNQFENTNFNTLSIGRLSKQLSALFLACLLAVFLVIPTAHAVDKLNPPTIKTPIISGDNTIKGEGRFSDKKGPKIIVTVTVKDALGNIVETKSSSASYNPKWSVKLSKTVSKGYTVTAYQEYDPNDPKFKKGTLNYDDYKDKKSDETDPVTVEASVADKYEGKLSMPNIEVWIENKSSDQLNTDEKKEIIDAFMAANKEVVGENGKKFGEMTDVNADVLKIDTLTSNTTITVTFSDKSKLTFDTKNVTYKQVTETSAAPTIEKVQVTDTQIIVTLEKEVAPGTKFYFVKNFTDGEDKKFCGEGKCKADKSTKDDLSQAVSVDGKKVTFTINNDDLKLGKDFGIIVKEPHKFSSCAMSKPVVTTPDKVNVRDPHKLTDEDKKAIDNAIREANKVKGVSKLPDEFQGSTYPAIIEFDKDGNVTIISPNDVVISDWDSDYNPIFAKNPDGTYKLNSGAKVTKFPAKDLVKNLKPNSPSINVDTDNAKVTITPPAYENPGEDTDLASFQISYSNKTVTITRTVDETTGKSTWSTPDGVTVDGATGVVTLNINDLALGDIITAKAKDKGGLEGDTNPLESDPASTQLETVEVSYDANGGSGIMDSRRLNKGLKYTILENKFTAPSNQEFVTWKIDGENVEAGTEITVNKDTIIKAIWKKSLNKNIKVPQTGDINLFAICSLAILSVLGLATLYIKRRINLQK